MTLKDVPIWVEVNTTVVIKCNEGEIANFMGELSGHLESNLLVDHTMYESKNKVRGVNCVSLV